MATVVDTRKTVLITGCSPGGIGYSLAIEFHQAGGLAQSLPVVPIDSMKSCTSDPFYFYLFLFLFCLGLRVFATARTTDVLNDLADQGIETFALDVTSLDDIKRVRETITGLTGGTLDILVNNA